MNKLLLGPLGVAPLALLVIVMMMPAQGAHAYWDGWDGGGIYGQGWKHYGYGGEYIGKGH